MQVERGRLRTEGAIGLRAGRVVNRFKMAKHFELEVGEGSFTYRRLDARIAAEAALDGIHVVRTSVNAQQLDAAEVVTAYKSLANAERAFRTMKTVDIKVRPIFHFREDRVRAHLLLCMLAAYVQWHMERALAPLIFRDEAPPQRPDPVAPAPRSEAASAKDAAHRTSDGELPVSSFHTLLRHLATLVQNRIAPDGLGEEAAFEQLTIPTPLQAKAFELLGFSPGSV